jgi:hypothetical protein
MADRARNSQRPEQFSFLAGECVVAGAVGLSVAFVDSGNGNHDAEVETEGEDETDEERETDLRFDEIGVGLATPLLAGRYLNVISSADFPDSFTQRRDLLQAQRYWKEYMDAKGSD